MSGMTAVGIILVVVSAITIGIVFWMFWWASREEDATRNALTRAYGTSSGFGRDRVADEALNVKGGG